uniref:RING-type E3 ubiquitin transferase n=1 Tax=Anser cygnoides TaxID=8845 RepID=A0A8B9DRZ0_ANSCY
LDEWIWRCVESMATALDTRCPICLDSWVNPSFVVPCLHRFCFECIQRWAESKPECPLCKRRVRLASFFPQGQK